MPQHHFVFFGSAPLKRTAYVYEIFKHHKDIHFDITSFHFKNQLDANQNHSIQDLESPESLTSQYNNQWHCEDNEPSDVSYICLRN